MSPRSRNALIAAVVIAVAVAALAFEVVTTRPVRGAVRSFFELIAIANRDDDQRIEAARPYLSSRYLATHPIQAAEEGGLVGLPRSIHRNFQAWRQGDEVWICPSNRVGSVFRLVEEGGGWRFDGLVGLLQSGNVLVPADEPADIPPDQGTSP